MKVTVTRIVTETIEFTLADALKIIATSTFRNFDKCDWMAYNGCESDNPMIANIEWNGLYGDVILDGTEFEFHFFDNDDIFRINCDMKEF